MPNTGRPSKDCHTCRKRRVKCDLARPACQRCIRIGKECSGYRDESTLMFRNEDIESLSGPSSLGDRRRSRQDESSESEEPIRSILQTSTDILIGPAGAILRLPSADLTQTDRLLFAQEWVSPILTSLTHHWERYSIALLFSMFSIEFSARRLFGQMSFLPEMLSQCSENSAIFRSCQAVGLAYLANRVGSHEMVRIRDVTYGNALTQTNALVGDALLCKEDETLASVWLLSLYELLVGAGAPDSKEGHVSWGIHIQGLVGLLQIRGLLQLNNARGRDLFWLVGTSIQIRSLTIGSVVPPFISELTEELQKYDPVAGTELVDLNSFVLQAADIATQSNTLSKVEDSAAMFNSIEDLWNRLEQLGACLEQVSQDHMLGEPVSISNLHLCTYYRTCYIRALQRMYDFLNTNAIHEVLGDSHEKCKVIATQIESIVQQNSAVTLEAIAPILNASLDGLISSDTSQPLLDRPICWSDILRLLWPLRVIAARKHLVADSQVQTIDLTLQKLGTQYCIGQAVAPLATLDGL